MHKYHAMIASLEKMGRKRKMIKKKKAG